MSSKLYGEQLHGCQLLDGNTAAEVGTLYEFDQTISKKWFDGSRYGRLGTIGDGSCFFHSICMATNLQQYCTKNVSEKTEIVKRFRAFLAAKFTPQVFQELVQELNNPLKPTETYEQIIANFGDKKIWADEIMIRWCSKALNKNIIFMNLGNNVNRPYCNIHLKSVENSIKRCSLPKEPTIVVAWISNSHFELVVRIDTVTDQGIQVTKEFYPFEARNPKKEEDTNTVLALMHAYTQQCNV